MKSAFQIKILLLSPLYPASPNVIHPEKASSRMKGERAMGAGSAGSHGSLAFHPGACLFGVNMLEAAGSSSTQVIPSIAVSGRRRRGRLRRRRITQHSTNKPENERDHDHRANTNDQPHEHHANHRPAATTRRCARAG